MEQVLPPDISARAPAVDDVEVDVAPEGIARDELLRQYLPQMVEPRAERKVLEGELRSWSGSLARTDWFAQTYHPTAALVMKGRRPRVSDAATVETIVAAVVELVDPLARYSAGWSTSLAVLRPKKLRGTTSRVVREAQRYGAREVRRGMTTTEPIVHKTQSAAASFLADPARRHAQDRQTAVDAYLKVITKMVVDGQMSPDRYTDTELYALSELQNSLVEELGAVPAPTLSAGQESRNREIAVKFLDDIVKTRLPGRTYDPAHLSEAYDRVLVTYMNRLGRGLDLEGTEDYLFLRLAAVRVDEWRRELHRKRHEGQFVAGDDHGSRRADDRIEDSVASSGDGEADRALLRRAISLIVADPQLRIGDQLCWEAAIACVLLAGGAPEFSGSQQDLAAAITQRWVDEEPAHARSATAQIAVTDVLLLMRTSVNQALRLRGEPDGEGTTA